MYIILMFSTDRAYSDALLSLFTDNNFIALLGHDDSKQ